MPSNQIAFSDIPRLDPLPTVHIEKEAKERLRDWANTFGKAVKQCSVRKETCSYKCGTLALYAYDQVTTPSEPIVLKHINKDISSELSDESDESSNETNENQLSEYDSD